MFKTDKRVSFMQLWNFVLGNFVRKENGLFRTNFRTSSFRTNAKFFVKPIGRNRLQQLPRTKGRKGKERKVFCTLKEKDWDERKFTEKQVLPKGLFVCGSFKIQVIVCSRLRKLLFLSIMVCWKIEQNNCVERWTDQ